MTNTKLYFTDRNMYLVQGQRMVGRSATAEILECNWLKTSIGGQDTYYGPGEWKLTTLVSNNNNKEMMVYEILR